MAVIDLLRGFAAMWVVMLHFVAVSDYIQGGPVRSLADYGWLGVEIFFVISGFLIPYSLWLGGYRPGKDWLRFIAKRLMRLEPPYLASLLISVALLYACSRIPGYGGPPPQVTLTQLFLHLGYLNAFFHGEWLNGVYWTLAVEFQYYLLIALLFGLISHSRGAIRHGVALALCGCAFFVHSKHYVPHFLPLFVLGISTFNYHARNNGLKTYLIECAAIGVMSYFALGGVITLAGLATALIIAGVRIPRCAPIVFMSNISYSIYLIHLPIGERIVNLGRRLGPGALTKTFVLITAVAVTIAVAYAFHRLIEKPAQEWASKVKFGAASSSGRSRKPERARLITSEQPIAASQGY